MLRTTHDPRRMARVQVAGWCRCHGPEGARNRLAEVLGRWPTVALEAGFDALTAFEAEEARTTPIARASRDSGPTGALDRPEGMTQTEVRPHRDSTGETHAG